MTAFVGTISTPWRGIFGANLLLPFGRAVMGNGANLFGALPAANPVAVSCTTDTWQLVAEDVTDCIIHKTNFAPSKYLQTYRVADDPAPTNDNDAVSWFGLSLRASFDSACDIYIKAVSADGKVRVDG